jgi:2-hydroxy-6-oxonona-2,4-dienedioate hydrolase
LPLALPGVVTAVIFTFIQTWNEFVVALTLTSTPDRQPLTVGITTFIGQYQVQWQFLFAASLVAIVPATHSPDRPSLQAMTPTQERMLFTFLGSDFLFWSSLGLMHDRMIGTMLATDPALLAAASPAEKARTERIMRGILPVSRRQRGLMNDAKLTANPARQDLEKITAPTLAISLEDDRFGTLDGARYLAAQVPGARLVAWPTGGHVWIGHDEDLFAEIDAFLRENA